MKKLIFTILGVLILCGLFAQDIPHKISYQGKLLENGYPVNGTKSITFTIGSWHETHSNVQVTDGLYSVTLGEITPIPTSIFNNSSSVFLQIKVEGTTLSPTTEILSVPYAYKAEKAVDAENTFSGDYNDLTNQPTIPTNVSQLTNDAGYITDGNTGWDNTYGFITSPDDADADTTNEIQTLSQNGTNVTLSNGGGTVSVADNDNSSTNEIQTLSISGNDLSISSGNTVSLPSSGGENLSQTLAIGNSAGSYDIDMDNEEVKNASRLDLYDSQNSYLDLYYGKIRDWNDSYGNSGQVLTCGSSTSHYVTWQTISSGGENLSQTLAIGNSAGSYDIDMDNEEVKNASRLDLYDNQDSYLDLYYGKIRDWNGNYGNSGQVLTCGSSTSHYVTWQTISSGGENLSQTLAIGNSAGNYDINMNNKEVKNASRLDLDNQNSYIDLYYGKIRDYWGFYGNSGQVLTCGSSTSHYVTWQTVSKEGSSFKIDHPLNPENKYLEHSTVSSPDMLNVYNGNVVLDNNGEATVKLPEYFEALNKEFRYQLTCIGGYAPVYVAKEISDNSFEIAGGKAGMKVSWQVTGVRQDPFANQHRIQVEVEKSAKEKGHYLHYKEYNQPIEKSIEAVKHPEMLEKLKGNDK